jgi:LCP family protein required for cell wall assembly
MRVDRHQKPKKKKWTIFFLVVLLLIVGVGAYSYFQYQQGVNQSLKKTKTKKVVYTFKGQKDQYGDTNVLLLGRDSSAHGNSRSDSIIVVSYNQAKKVFKMASIMRDSYVAIPGHGKHKINAAFAYGGPDLLRQTLKQNFDIDMQYYTILDFEGFVQVIDEVFPNGVEINVEKEMSKNIGVTLKPGLQKLDGKHLLGYVRFRHDAIGDFGRVKRQQEALQAMGEQLNTLETIPKLPKLMGIISPYVTTNMSDSDMIFMAKDYLTKKSPVATIRIPIDNSFTEPRISGEGDILDIDIAKNRDALHQFLSQ